MHNIAIIYAIIATKNTCLAISNFGDKPVALKAGQTLTTATPLEDGTRDASNSTEKANNPDNKLVSTLVTILSVLTAVPIQKYEEMANRTGNLTQILPKSEFIINLKLKTKERSKFLSLLREYDHIFAKGPYDLGRTHLNSLLKKMFARTL
jgi:hypothetical protein